MMEPFYEQYLERLERLHQQIVEAIVGLPVEALDWSPGTEMNSLAVLVTHVCGSERYWIGDAAMGETSNRDREAEFRVSGVDQARLIQRLDETLSYTRHALERFRLQDLEKAVLSPRDGEESTVGACLLHALDHTAIHLGHVQLTQQLWEIRQA